MFRILGFGILGCFWVYGVRLFRFLGLFRHLETSRVVRI